MILGKTGKRKAEAAYSRSQEEEIGLVYVESLCRQGKYSEASKILCNYSNSIKNYSYIQELSQKISFLIKKQNLITPKSGPSSSSKSRLR
jgi:hypothetical protein